MDEVRLRCPSCGARAWPTRPVAAGQRLRCGRCGAAFRAGDEGASTRDGEGTRKGTARTGTLLLILGITAGVLLLGAGGVGLLVILTPPRGGDNGRPASAVTAADLGKLAIFMTKDQVEAALGEGKLADVGDLHPAWAQAGRQTGATAWYRWGDGDDTLFVGFGRGGSGTQRAVISFLVHKFTRGGGAREETTPGFMNLDPFGADLDDLASDKGKEDALLKDPRWKRGPEIRKALVGFWVAVGVGGYDFKADGACRSEGSGDKSGGTYAFTDDEHIQVTLKADPAFAGQQVEARTVKYKVLVDERELILIDDRFPGAHPVVYQRAK